MENVTIGLLLLTWVLFVFVSWQDNRADKSVKKAFIDAYDSWCMDVTGYQELPPFAYEDLVSRVEAVAQSNTRSHLTAWGRGKIRSLVVVLCLLALLSTTGGR